ncbi:MAG: hypothetical protein FJ104_11590 [Deltaproteobacteria bacterium]|nr:hypothetical protein [Deltaproteobacteria bacterium]
MHDPLASASPLVTFGIPGLALVVGLVACWGHASTLGTHGARRAMALGAALLAGWATLTGALAGSGVLLRFDVRPPPFVLLFLAILAIGLTLGLGPVGRRVATLPLAALVGLHAFRFPLELVMHRAAMDGVMPLQMSYSGWNFDILTGLTAIPVAVLAHQGRAPRWSIVAWNLLGTTLLVVIVSIALSSSPLLMAFGTDPARVNTWVGHFPFVYLPTVLVTTAMAGHVALWRRLAATALAGREVAASNA